MSDTIERMAAAGYEQMVFASGFLENQHPWEKEPNSLKNDWRRAAKAMMDVCDKDRDAEIAKLNRVIADLLRGNKEATGNSASEDQGN